MKYDLSKPLNRSSQRVLSAVLSSLHKLLCEKSFESISVAEICNLANYPRATFYNYFDDKYDLLNFFLTYVSRRIHFEEFALYTPDTVFDVYFDRIYDLLEQYEASINLMLTHNTEYGYFISSCRIFLARSIRSVIEHLYSNDTVPVPINIISEHCANTLLLVFGYKFGKKQTEFTKKDTRDYLHYLLSGSKMTNT